MSALMPSVGERFGTWTVVGEAVTRARYQKYIPCRCDCGTEREVWQADLRGGGSLGCKSCQISRRNRTHGDVESPEYRIWAHIVERCTKAYSNRFEGYGGRGITVCDRWRTSYPAFLADMGRRPSADHSIERKDNAGPYSPENCVWATRIEQANNKRNNHRIVVEGVSKTIAEWARVSGLSPSLIYARVSRLGWPGARAVSEPAQVRRG